VTSTFTTSVPPGTRVLLYLYGRRNLVACLVALAGPVMLFLGFIHQGWLLITAGLYACAYLLTPAPPLVEAQISPALPFPAQLAELDRIIGEIRPQLQPEMLQHLDSIRSSIAEVAPRLTAATPGDEALYTVRETVARYLPETLGNYVRLPPLFRVTRELADGRTARALLTDQLAVLSARMKEVVTQVARADTDALLANGQFLRERFGTRDFLLAEATGGTADPAAR
jgi:hypothetical protein